MALTVTASFGPNDLTGAPQALLQGGPFHGSVVEITDEGCEHVTITEDDTTARYENTATHTRDGKLIFFHITRQ